MANKTLPNEKLGRLTAEEYREGRKYPVKIILDNVRSLHNVGSVFRTADAFLIEEVVLCGITAKPPHREIQKTALGATETVQWSYHSNTLDIVRKMKSEGYKIYGIEQTTYGIMLNQANLSPSDKTALVFGHEVHGIDEKVIPECDECIEIPQMGTKHSFNISVTVGMILWELFRNDIK